MVRGGQVEISLEGDGSQDICGRFMIGYVADVGQTIESKAIATSPSHDGKW